MTKQLNFIYCTVLKQCNVFTVNIWSRNWIPTIPINPTGHFYSFKEAAFLKSCWTVTAALHLPPPTVFWTGSGCSAHTHTALRKPWKSPRVQQPRPGREKEKRPVGMAPSTAARCLTKNRFRFAGSGRCPRNPGLRKTKQQDFHYLMT